MMKDVLGRAISDYYHQQATGRLWVNNKYGPKEEMPIATYFRSPDEMPELEWVALRQCRGRVLDIGAGAGSHALALQEMGAPVVALDISPLAAEVMTLRGVRHVITSDFFQLDMDPFDTLFMTMNGIGLAGTLDGLVLFLDHARKLLTPGGQLILDSSDIAYLYEGRPPKGPPYYGEILYQYEYRRQRSDWFKWLFIDRMTFGKIAKDNGWNVELLFEDGYDQYLVRCTVNH